ncbi:uncharacterized protein [Panulirus ornatus]|uniref:uncharacterized protein n=1 Tax=Panulirus ornatus TaxID=150431 RepID=UPI003A841A75
MDFRAIEKLKPCPYNPVHQILPHRMAQHLVKCKKNYPNADMKVCVFNATHVIPTPEYQAHILECDSRSTVERELYRRKETDRELLYNRQMAESRHQVAQPQARSDSASQEDWDSEMVLSSYNPNESIVYKEIPRQPPPGLGKAGRRKWREREIERVQRLRNGLPIDDLIYPPTNEDTTGDDFEAIGASGRTFGSGIKLNRYAQGIPGQMAQSPCNQVMKADVPLRRPRIPIEHHSRIAANIFGNITQAQSTSSSQGSDNSMEQVLQSSGMTQQKKECIKEKRKIEKKLCEIKKLEVQRDDGCKLTEQEIEKLGKRSDLETRLA